MLTPMRQRRSRSRGITMVEVLVGIAIGLVLVGGVLSLFVTNLVNSRRMLVEARVNQDMRAAADLITRDLRRAAYWGNSIDGTKVFGGATTPTRNPYQAIAPDTAASSITYTFSRDVARGVAENNVPDDDEGFGFRLNGGTIQMRTSLTGNWQPVTDPNVMTVTGLALTVSEIAIDARTSCSTTCAGTACPVLTRRNYRLVMTATAVADPAVVRELDTRSRIRNDSLTGTCPAA